MFLRKYLVEIYLEATKNSFLYLQKILKLAY